LSALKSSCLTPLPSVKQDDFKALKFYQKACDLNNGTGCFNLGFMYGVKQDDLKALKFSQKACGLNYINPRLEQPLP
jgi:TPR repeat protein